VFKLPKFPGFDAIELNLGKSFVKWSKNVEYLRERGFAVDDAEVPFNLVGAFDRSSGKRELHGVFFWGHGAPDGISNKDMSWEATYIVLKYALAYKMGFVVLNACFSDHSSAETNIKFWHPSRPFTFQTKRKLDAGGHDLVSPNGLFGGAKRILSPFQNIPFLRLKWKFGFDPHHHAWEILKPGQQETKK
jgi:hypothetical protein